MMNAGKQLWDGRISAGTLFATFLFAPLYRASPTGYSDLIAFCVFTTLIAFTIGLGVSSIRHSRGGDKKCGIAVLIVTILATTWILVSLVLHPDS